MSAAARTRATYTARGIEALVCEEIARRQAHGLAKYGTSVADNPLDLRAWLQHALEETLDQAIYLRRAIAELDKPQANPIKHAARAESIAAAPPVKGRGER